jgi:lipopolysaccharide transport system ATP-binding protein
MKDVSGEGRTVFFVSHNMSAVKTLCNKAIFLNKGEIEFIGEIETAISKYYKNEEKSASQNYFKKIHVPNIFS